MSRTKCLKQINHPQRLDNLTCNPNTISIIEAKLKGVIVEFCDIYDISVIKNMKEYKYYNERLKQIKRNIKAQGAY
jgi:hypothetical protein